MPVIGLAAKSWQQNPHSEIRWWVSKWVTKKYAHQNVPTIKYHHQRGRFVPVFDSNFDKMKLFNPQHLSV
jgi:hypothetical protein